MSYPIPMNHLMEARRAAVDAMASSLSVNGSMFALYLLAPGGFADAAQLIYEEIVNEHGPGLHAELLSRWKIYGPLMWAKWRDQTYLSAPLLDVLRMGRAEMKAIGWLQSLIDPGVPVMIATSVAILAWRLNKRRTDRAEELAIGRAVSA